MRISLFFTCLFLTAFIHSAYCQDTTLTFRNNLKIKFYKEQGTFRLDSKNFKLLRLELNHLQNSQELKEQENLVIKQNLALSDSTLKLNAQYLESEKQRAEEYKVTIEKLNKLLTEQSQTLKNCTADLDNCTSDLKKKQFGIKWKKVSSTLSGIAVGLAAGLVTGYVVGRK